MIRDSGWTEFAVWEHSESLRDLYRRRCRLEAEEMTAHAQAVELLEPLVQAGDTLLDVGCGSGYFFHALAKRGLDLDYTGIDASASLIEIGREELPRFGLDPSRLRVLRIEDLAGEVDHVVCVNVLSNLDNYHRPLERLLLAARKSLILRESLKEGTEYAYVADRFLDPGVELRVHVNAYDRGEIEEFVRSYGFDVRYVEDRRSGGQPELVIDHPHHWGFLVARRT